MSAQHTPGPWVFAKEDRPLPDIATVCRVGMYVVGVSTPGYPGGDYRNVECPDPAGESEARLIAAAPELLEALKKAQDALTNPAAKFHEQITIALGIIGNALAKVQP